MVLREKQTSIEVLKEEKRGLEMKVRVLEELREQGVPSLAMEFIPHDVHTLLLLLPFCVGVKKRPLGGGEVGELHLELGDGMAALRGKLLCLGESSSSRRERIGGSGWCGDLGFLRGDGLCGCGLQGGVLEGVCVGQNNDSYTRLPRQSL
jgi:hypothetical protein